MTQNENSNEQTTVQQNSDVDLTFKLSTVNKLLSLLDEAPHKYVRLVIDILTSESQKQLNEINNTTKKTE